MVVSPDAKVSVSLKAMGDAPSLKTKKYLVEPNNTVAWFTHIIRSMINLTPQDSLFLYVNTNFAPSPDHTFQLLRDCYATGPDESKTLVMQYSITPVCG